MAERIDLNADLGEGGVHDTALFALISSASIACGGHAGDAPSMRAALRGCKAHGVVAGAHPSFNDRENFGRQALDQAHEETARDVVAQIAALQDVAAAEGVPLAYVKLHGALANRASRDEVLARTVFSAVAAAYPALAILALAHSAQERAARALDRRVVAEAYADRAYTADGQLAPRRAQGAVLTDPAVVVAQCLRLVGKGEILTTDGTVMRSHAQSICLHGDTPDALALAQAVRAALMPQFAIVSPLA